ncbi:MAG TPA: nicotinate-nucleotide adenylyltransferase [Terriglobales bacterium]|nr:nicotinate-nucleotide adenylyltransferase [Terriglobales bacterium]
MNIAFFGGTFDPIHRGHIAVAESATKRFELGKVLFVPAELPPHKQNQSFSGFAHRMAMVALATRGHLTFVPSDIEARLYVETNKPNYSLETIRHLKRELKKADKLYFLIGIDAFIDIAKWHRPADLLRECEFIVANRPGYSLGDIAGALPQELRPKDEVLKAARKTSGDLASSGAVMVFSGIVLHLLEDVSERVSSTQLRAAAASSGRRLEGYVGDAVAEYIRKTRLYRTGTNTEPSASPPAPTTPVKKKSRR